MKKTNNIMKDERVKAGIALGLFLLAVIVLFNQTTIDGESIKSLLIHFLKSI